MIYSITSGSSTTAAQNNPWRYTGGFQDPTDGYYHLGARYYDTAGHFAQADALGGSIIRAEKYNSYAYTAGDPCNKTDLSGMDACDPQTILFAIGGYAGGGAGVGAVVGAVVAAIPTAGIGFLAGVEGGAAIGGVIGAALGISVSLGECAAQLIAKYYGY